MVDAKVFRRNLDAGDEESGVAALPRLAYGRRKSPHCKLGEPVIVPVKRDKPGSAALQPKPYTNTRSGLRGWRDAPVRGLPLYYFFVLAINNDHRLFATGANRVRMIAVRDQA
jgi:hypothetical protein